MGCGSPKAKSAALEPQAQDPGVPGSTSSSSKSPAKVEAWSGVVAQEKSIPASPNPSASVQEQKLSAVAPSGNRDSSDLPRVGSEEKLEKPSVVDAVGTAKKSRRRSDGDLLAPPSTEAEEAVTPTMQKRNSLHSQKSEDLFGFGADTTPPKPRRSSVGGVPTNGNNGNLLPGKVMGRRRSESSALATGGGLGSLSQSDNPQHESERSDQAEGEKKATLGRRRSLQAQINAGSSISTNAAQNSDKPATWSEGLVVDDEEEATAPKPTLGRRRSFESLMATNAQPPMRQTPSVKSSASIESEGSARTTESNKGQGQPNQLGKRRLSANAIVGGEKPLATQRNSSNGAVGKRQSIKEAVRRNSQTDW